LKSRGLAATGRSGGAFNTSLDRPLKEDKVKDKEQQKRYDKARYQRTKEAAKKRAKDWRTNNSDRYKEVQKEYYKTHKAQIFASMEKNKDSARDRVLRKLGWTLEMYLEAEREQKGLCYICNKPWDRALAADHDHETLQPRKLLCGNCNASIGLLQDSSEIANKAAEYLRKFGK
jgi:Recombination endonuclease VII